MVVATLAGFVLLKPELSQNDQTGEINQNKSCWNTASVLELKIQKSPFYQKNTSSLISNDINDEVSTN